MIRENTEDLYKGIEYMVGDDVAHGIKLILEKPVKRFVVMLLNMQKQMVEKKSQPFIKRIL